MDGRDFIYVAEELVKASTEAHWRSATSRAYYGAFHSAKDALERRGFQISKGSSAHGEVKNQLLNHSNKDVSSAGSLLANLHRNRIKCDYRLVSRNTSQNDATLDVWSANKIAKCIKKHL